MVETAAGVPKPTRWLPCAGKATRFAQEPRRVHEVPDESSKARTGTRSSTTRAWPIASICSSRAISIRRKNAFRICANGWRRSPPSSHRRRRTLKHSPKVHTETAIDQMKGAVSFVREGLNPLLDRAPEMKKELAPLQEKTARRAGRICKNWLKEDLLPRSTAISASAWTSFARNSVSRSPPICRSRN